MVNSYETGHSAVIHINCAQWWLWGKTGLLPCCWLWVTVPCIGVYVAVRGSWQLSPDNVSCYTGREAELLPVTSIEVVVGIVVSVGGRVFLGVGSVLVTACRLCRCDTRCRCDRRRISPPEPHTALSWLPQCTGSLKGSYPTVVRRSHAPTVIPLTSTLSATAQSIRSGKFACQGQFLFTVYHLTFLWHLVHHTDSGVNSQVFCLYLL